MSHNKGISAGFESSLPGSMLRVHLAAPAGQPTARLEASQPVTLIGGRQDCDLSIRQGDVSKVHCALVNTGRVIIAADLCSRAGTFVNGRRVSVATLSPGDELRVGQVRVAVRLLDTPERAAWPAAGKGDVEFALPVPLRLKGAERQHELTTLPAVIGRRHACSVVLDTPDVSLAHALLFAIDDCPAIFDLGSRSGTYLNDQRVTLAWLHAGDRLCIGGEELTLAWEGPERSQGSEDSVAAVEAADPQQPRSTLQPPGLADLSALVDRLESQLSASEALLRERTGALHHPQAGAEMPTSVTEEEQTRLALEQQKIEQRAAELQAASLRIEQDRARLDELRAQSERERAELTSQRAELERRLAEYQTNTSELKRRESELHKREAALATAERVLAEKQAELAQREAACLDAARQIEQFKEVFSGAQRIFGSIGTTMQPASASAGRSTTVGSPELESSGDAPHSGAPADAALPAPLVDKPLFKSLENGARQ